MESDLMDKNTYCLPLDLGLFWKSVPYKTMVKSVRKVFAIFLTNRPCQLVVYIYSLVGESESAVQNNQILQPKEKKSKNVFLKMFVKNPLCLSQSLFWDPPYQDLQSEASLVSLTPYPFLAPLPWQVDGYCAGPLSVLEARLQGAMQGYMGPVEKRYTRL